MKRSKKKHRIDWHSGFAGGLGLCFRKYRDYITIEREHLLSKQPNRIDFLVVKKQPDILLDNAIGRGFRTHNIIEYKNPYDALNIDVIWKVIGYAGLYKSQGPKVNQIKADEITISIFRDKISPKLIKSLQEEKLEVISDQNGIYKVKGLVEIPIYLVAISELSEDELLSLKIMVKNANEASVRAFINESRKYSIPGDKSDADAVLQVSCEANSDMFRRMRGDDDMCEALKEIMAEDLEKEREKGIQLGKKEGIKEGTTLRDTEKITGMLNKGKTPEEIADFCDYPLEQVMEVFRSITEAK